MKVKWHVDATDELDEAALYYGNNDDELGERFEVNHAVSCRGGESRGR